MKKILLCFIATFALLHAYSQAGSLDHSFAGKGWTATYFLNGYNYSMETKGQVLVQKDSNYIVVFKVSLNAFYTVLARYFKNGTMDTKFGTGGYSVPVQIGEPNASLQSDPKAVLQSDGKIVIGGDVLARFNTNGSLDNTFGNAGLATIDFFATSLAIQPDGKIVVAGQAGGGFALARYNTNGSLDNSFDGDGMLTTSFGGDDNANSLAIQADGKIVAGGWASNPNRYNYDFALARYTTDGSLDTSFSGDGKLTTDFGSGSSANSLAIQKDGKIVVTGWAGSDFALARYNSDGSLDNTFDRDGKLTTDFNGGADIAYSLAIQKDGKIVVAGTTYFSSFFSEFVLARYNSNGTLDNSFDGDGKLTTDFGLAEDAANSLAIQPDGKIVVAGQAITPDGGNPDFALARYNSNGSLDNSFDGDGKLTSYYLAGNTTFTAIAIQPDGKIVVAGQANGDFALVRHNSNGSLDNSFDGDGKLTGIYLTINAIAIQKDGKIVVAGGTNGDFALARYNSNGTLDTSFDGDGKLITNISGGASSLAIQKDGKIVVGGNALARFNTNGSLDNTFGNTGLATINFSATSLAIQPNGKIVVAGGTNGDFGLARYNSNGSLDNSFDGDGKQTTDFGFGNDYASSLAIQTDGKIVVAGSAGGDFALARYNSNGSLDSSFDGDGKKTTGFYSPDDHANSLAIQRDGKIVVAGGGNGDFAFARYNSNGSLDNSFSCDGKQTTDFNGGNDIAAAVAIRNNRIYVAGYSKLITDRGIVAAYQTGPTTLAAPAITSIAVSTNLIANQQPVTQQLTVTVSPNPTAQYFTLRLQSNVSTSTATVSITDAAGRLIEKKNNVNANSSLQLGHNYPPGIYFAQIVQGDKKEVVKLVKQ